MNSIWLTVPNYPNYKVSPEGSILSLKGKPKILKDRVNQGYNKVVLSKKGKKQKEFFVHRIVASVFNKKHSNHVEVNHKDGNKLNNHYRNLEWCTKSQNQRHRHDILKRYVPCGVNKPLSSKLTEKQVVSIFKDKVGTYKQISNKYGVSIATIGNIKTRKSWKHLTGEL